MVGQTTSKASTTPSSAPCLICGAAGPALTAGMESGQYPERSEARSEASSAFLPLKLEHDYFHLLSLTPLKLKSHRYIFETCISIRKQAMSFIYFFVAFGDVNKHYVDYFPKGYKVMIF